MYSEKYDPFSFAYEGQPFDPYAFPELPSTLVSSSPLQHDSPVSDPDLSTFSPPSSLPSQSVHPDAAAPSLSSPADDSDDDSDEDILDSDPSAYLSVKDGETVDDEKKLAELDKLPAKGRTFVITDANGDPAVCHLSLGTIRHIKQCQFRDKYLQERLQLSWNDPQLSLPDSIRLRIFHSVSPNTFSGYASHWNVLEKAGYDISVMGLMNFLEAKKKQGKVYANASLCHWKSAVDLFCAATGNISGELWNRYHRGYCKSNPNGVTKKRGAITRDRLLELCSHSTVKGSIYEDAFQLQYAIALRSGQMQGMHSSHFRLVKDKKTGRPLNYVYVVPKHKHKDADITTAIEHHVCDPNSFDLISRVIKDANKYRSGFLCPGWDEVRARKLISDAAPDLGWDASLQWVNHSVRHGSCVDAALSAPSDDPVTRLEHVQARSAQKSATVARDYSQSPEYRALYAKLQSSLPAGFTCVSYNGFSLLRNKNGSLVVRQKAVASAFRNAPFRQKAVAMDLDRQKKNGARRLGDKTMAECIKLITSHSATPAPATPKKRGRKPSNPDADKKKKPRKARAPGAGKPPQAI